MTAEHDHFRRLTDALAVAADSALQIGALRGDLRWGKISALIDHLKDQVFSFEVVEQVKSNPKGIIQ